MVQLIIHLIDTIIISINVGMQIEYLLLTGDQCIQICSQALQEDPTNTPLNSYCSPDESQASTDYQKLSHLIDSGIMNS